MNVFRSLFFITIVLCSSVQASRINGKTFYARLDSGTAENWPNATGAEWTLTNRNTLVTLEVAEDGKFTFKWDEQSYTGVTRDITLHEGRKELSGVGLGFEQLGTQSIPMYVDEMGNNIWSAGKGVTVKLSTERPKPDFMAEKTFVGEIARGTANHWFKGKGIYQDGKVSVELIFDKNGGFNYSTDDKVSVDGTYRVSENNVFLHFEGMPVGQAYPATFNRLSGTLKLPLFSLKMED